MASKSLEKLDDKDSNDVVPDEEDEIQDLLNNEDIEFIDGLNVVDAWEGDTEEKTLDASPGNKSESKEGDSKRNSKYAESHCNFINSVLRKKRVACHF